MIRLAYALDSDNLEEVAEALGYWAISYLDINRASAGDATAAVKQELSDVFRILNEEYKDTRIEAPNIARRMEIVGAHDSFRRISALFDTNKMSPDLIAPLVLQLFSQTQDFTALHAVTATHALRVVSPYLNEAPDTLRDFIIAIAAAYVSIGAPRIQTRIYSREDPETLVVVGARF